MNRWWFWAGATAALALSGAACGLGHSCSDIGCGIGVSATLTPQSGTWKDGQYTLELALDGRKTQCAFQIANKSTPIDSTRLVSCGGGVRMELRTNVDDFALHVLVDSTPNAVTLSLSRDGTVILTDKPTLAYRESYPNGPDCEVCRSASIELTVADE